MKINFVCNDYVKIVNGRPEFGWEPTDKRLGGTEESVREWAEELAKRGHKVQVFRNPKEWFAPTSYEGVAYAPTEMYKGGGDICINIKSSHIAPKEPTLYLTNETDATNADLSAYDGVIWPSQWAVDNIPVNNRTFILPHGYDETKIKPGSKVKKQCLYASSPDRGLKILETIWPSVVEQHPDAMLYVTYGGQIDAPNTVCGEFTEEEMNELYNTSDIWVHPCSGGELYGISGVKAQAAGAIPVYFPTMALAETVQGGITCKDAREMYKVLCTLLGDEKAKKAHREDLVKLKLPTWKDSTDRLLGIIKEVIK